MRSSAREAAETLLNERMQHTFHENHLVYERETGLGTIPRAYLQNAIRIVQNSGVMVQLEKWDGDQRKSNAGRKPDIPKFAVLVLMLVHVQLGHGVNFHSIARSLDQRLFAEEFALLGIRDRPGDHWDWYQRFWQSLNRLLKLIDPYPTPRNRRLPPEQYAELLERQGTDDARDRSRRNLERIDWICEQLVHESVRTLPQDIWDTYRGNIAIDATEIIVPGLPNPKSPSYKRGNADPQSGRYRREGKHDGKGAKTDHAAYELETAVMIWNEPRENDLFPTLITAVSFHRPGELTGHAVKLIRSHQCFGFTRFLVVLDRAYSQEKPEHFQILARLLGCELVMDYKYTVLGQQGSYRDLILVDGNWYVRWMPKHLITATRDFHDGVITEEVAHSYIANRAPYRMTAKGLPDADGFQRFAYPPYPATGYIPIDPLTEKPIKPRNPGSLTIPMLITEDTSADDKKQKKQKKQKKPEPVKHLQKFAYPDAEWHAHYSMRPIVEASNKLMKDASAEDLGNPAKRSGRGYAFQYLASTLAAVSSNLRRIFTYYKNAAKRDLGQKFFRDRRRKGSHGKSLPRPTRQRSLAPPP